MGVWNKKYRRGWSLQTLHLARHFSDCCPLSHEGRLAQLNSVAGLQTSNDYI